MFFFNNLLVDDINLMNEFYVTVEVHVQEILYVLL
jgi:hypothetical protein